MATLQHAGSRRMYSWWWDSHISPKNSKWLQENLTDMDAKVKAMIKVIEEDADSFARRAEMYYRKRPELLKLVEEFYRAYRALAERYDHATGALRQAQRTMAEAFPDQVPFILSDESPSGPYATEAEPHTPEMLPPTHTFFDLDDSQKDSFGTSPHSHAIKRNGASFEEKFAEGRVRKGLNFQEEEVNGSVCKAREEVSQLSSENQNLKNQILSEAKRAAKAEAEIQSLKDVVSKLSSEKEDAFLKYQLSLERMTNLENEFSSTQQNFRKLSDEMLIEAGTLKRVKEQCLVLEKENKSLQLDLETCRQSAKKLQEELTWKQEVLEKLDISIQDERKKCMQSETALLLIGKLHSQSQEEARILALEVQSGAEKLKNMALSKVGLEEEMRRLTEENSRLNDQLLSSALKIKNLEDELNFLKESKQKLDVELGLHIDEKKVLQEEICYLKADKNDLEQKLRELAEQINSVNASVVSLQALVKELQDGNVQLKERCNKQGNEKVLLLENLKHMENISEKNAVLENSLSDANAELEGLRQKIKALEESCEFLHGSISVHTSEKASLVSHVESITQKVEKLSEKNTLLENSLSDVNVELEGLRGKLTVFEESCQFLKDQRSSLLTEKSNLVSEVESVSHSLEKLESHYEELEGKKLSLEREKDKALDQVRDLQNFLQVEKQKHEALIEASKRQLTALEKQILLLQNEVQRREVELEVEQHKIMNAQFEIFILQRCLGESVETNFILLDECQKNLDASRCAEKIVLKLEQEGSVQQKNLALLSERNQKLMEGLHLMMKMLNIHDICGFSNDTQDDLSFVQLILHKIRDLQTSFSDAQDDNHCVLLDKSIILTLLERLELDMANLKSEKNVVEQESKTRAEKLSALQNEKHGLVEANEQLTREVKDCNQREDVLKAEMKILYGQISDSQEVRCTIESEVCRLLEENKSLSRKCYDLMERNNILEEENSAILVEAMNLECLYLIFSRSNAERALEVQLLHHNLDNLHEARRDLEKMIRVINEKLGALEVENMHLKEVIVDLEESNRNLVFLEDELSAIRNVSEQLNLEIETWKVLLVEKDRELADANQKIETTQENNDQLCRNLEDLMLDISGAKVMKEKLEEKIIALSEDNHHRDNEITCLRKANEMLKGEHDKRNYEMEELRNREKHFISELEEKTSLVNSSEADAVVLLDDIQIATINAAVFEEKVHELLLARESLEIKAMVQREMLHEEFKLRNIYEDELKEKLDVFEGENRSLKEELNAYLPLVMSLSNRVASLEEHTLSLTNHYISNSEEKQASPSVSLQHNESNQEEIEVLTASAGILELRRLHTKVNVLEKMLMNANGLLEQERSVSNANSETAVGEITGLESNRTTSQGEAETGKDIILELESEKPSTDHNLQGGDIEIATVKTEQMMKDIQLDHVLSSSQHENGVSSHAVSTMESAETEDQMLGLWESVSRDCNKMQKAVSVASEHDIEYHQIEAVEEEKNECPSGRVAEKELSIDKLELPQKVTGAYSKRSRSVIERLSSDAQRLLALQTSVQELKRDIETSEMSNHPTSLEFDTVKAQLKEAEGAISQLIDINVKLTKKSADFSASADSLLGEQNENGNGSEKKISEQARRGSEKIARLELELQKIQYILLKLKEEYENRRTKAMERRRSVLLRDYLYGSRESPQKKKVRCCACVKPKTKDD